MNIHTANSLCTQNRRLDRERQRRERMQRLADEAVARMRDRGFALHLTNRERTQVWWLGGDDADAHELPAGAAALLLQDSHVVAVDGGGLFGDTPQLWNWRD
jgi:hypothetical protein